MQGDLTRWGGTEDPRVKAAFVMAPLGLLFDAEGLVRVKEPVFLYYSEEDQVLIPSENAGRLRPLLKTLVGVKTVPRADHWVFLSPCSEALAKDAAMLCTDPTGVDRVSVHKQMNADASAFFAGALSTSVPRR
jgi:predicted dienelactone hydrolase